MAWWGNVTTFLGLLAFLLLVGCGPRAARLAAPSDSLAVQVASEPLAHPASCTNRFVIHPLEHTTLASDPIRLFESNGAGLAINDLDNDGDLDVVLANLKGSNTILWNEGGLTFRKEALPYPGTRAVQILDVDSDGWMDIVLARHLTPPLLWRNQGRDGAGQVRFEHAPLRGVGRPAYTLDWGDLDRDEDLDLVTASYDAGLMLEQENTFLFGDGGGVVVYWNEGEAFREQRLSREAQALALAVADITGDGQPEIAVGNDFRMADQYWTLVEAAWQPFQPFPATTYSTMSFDQADVNNDGRLEWFAADMKPYRSDIQTLAAWLPLMEEGFRTARPPGSLQRHENVLLVPDGRGRFRNEAYQRGLDASGWSWSSKFADLDNDGFVDFYAVNGMIATDLFPYLPDGELVEANQAFQNDGRGAFRPAPRWGLDSTASGRGMSMGDLDGDGDLDIVVNNLGSPAQLFENQLCGGASLVVALRWPGSANRNALGAKLVLETSTGRYTRTLRAASGYLSGDPARVHFGFPANSRLYRIELHWPDGQRSVVETLSPNTLVSITR